MNRKQRPESVISRAVGCATVTARWGAHERQQCGIPAVVTGLGVTEATVYNWINRGSLPFSELTGATDHARHLETMTGGRVTRAELIAEVEERQRERREARHA